MQTHRNLSRRRRTFGSVVTAFDLFDIEPDEPGPPSCSERLRGLKRDDVVTVGKTRWRVESNRYGVNSTYVVKAGTKGKKLYVLWATDLNRCCLEVREVSGGSGALVSGKAPEATGCFVERADDKTWAGRRAKRRGR